ncbi:hypothetical protein CRUP_023840, partial [Coryphaenoides rupestris]
MCRQLGPSIVVLLASALSCWVSVSGLVQGPLCLYNSTSGPTWGVPLQPQLDRSALQLLLTAGNLINVLLGALLGPGAPSQ